MKFLQIYHQPRSWNIVFSSLTRLSVFTIRQPSDRWDRHFFIKIHTITNLLMTLNKTKGKWTKVKSLSVWYKSRQWLLWREKAGSMGRRTNAWEVALKKHLRIHLFTDDSQQNKKASNKTEKSLSLVQNSKADDGCYEKKKASSMGRRTNDRGVAAKVSHYGGPWMGRRSSIVGFIKARPFKVKRDSYCCSRY